VLILTAGRAKQAGRTAGRLAGRMAGKTAGRQVKGIYGGGWEQQAWHGRAGGRAGRHIRSRRAGCGGVAPGAAPAH
jgi:hypothetical protein